MRVKFACEDGFCFIDPDRVVRVVETTPRLDICIDTEGGFFMVKGTLAEVVDRLEGVIAPKPARMGTLKQVHVRAWVLERFREKHGRDAAPGDHLEVTLEELEAL